MARKIFGKVMWVGRTAATVLGLALVLALVFGVATTAIGATGGNFILGKANAANKASKLAASIAGPALTLVNNSTNAAATALNITVASGQAPLKVNAEAGTATNLSADELDGRDASEFARGVDGVADRALFADSADQATSALNSDSLGGVSASDYQKRVSGQCAAGSSIQTIGADGTVTCEADDGGGGKAPDSELLDGRDSTAFANATHPHSGADITSGTVAEARIDGTVTRDGEVMPTVKANDGAGSGVDADTIDGQNSGAFASSSHNHDERYYTEGEVNTALSGKANTTHQHSGADITSGTVEADRLEDGAGSNLNANQLDGKDSSAFGIRTEHNMAYAHDCDTVGVLNECAPVTITVPAGKSYIVSVWSSFSAATSGLCTVAGCPEQYVEYCSAGNGPSIDTSNPCITPFGVRNTVRVGQDNVAASSSGETNALSAGKYTFYTAINPPSEELLQDQQGVVITKVMVRDATNGL